MATDIHIRIAKYDEESNKYYEVCLYHNRNDYEKYEYDEKGNKIEITDPYIRASCYSGRHYEMFDGMKHGDETDGYGVFPWYSIRLNSLEDTFKKDIKEKQEKEYYYDFYEISLPEIALYLEKHPRVADFDASEKEWDNYYNKKGSKPEKTNPIKYLYEHICSYIEFAECYYNISDYKVIFYFDS